MNLQEANAGFVKAKLQRVYKRGFAKALIKLNLLTAEHFNSYYARQILR